MKEPDPSSELFEGMIPDDPVVRMRNADAIEKSTVTIRNRDSWDQVRLQTRELAGRLRNYFDQKIDFPELGEKI